MLHALLESKVFKAGTALAGALFIVGLIVGDDGNRDHADLDVEITELFS